MADTPAPAPGETTTPPVVPQTDVTPPAPVNSSATPSANEDALRKEAEQARMRANQLQNELDKRAKTEQEAERKRLEETQQYKELYEKTEAELRTKREQEESAARQTELNGLTADVLKEYPEAVQSVAKTAGLTLAGDSDADKALLKNKLDELAKSVAPGQTGASNNPSAIPPPASPNTEIIAPELTPDGGEYVAKSGRIVTPMAMAGAKNDFSIANKYIARLKAVEQMRKDSGYTRTEA